MKQFKDLGVNRLLFYTWFFFLADFVTFTEEIFNEKFYFLCSDLYVIDPLVSTLSFIPKAWINGNIETKWVDAFVPSPNTNAAEYWEELE